MITSLIRLIRDIFSLFRRHGRLILVMTHRELTDRFAGSFLGPTWAIAHPLIAMGIYTVVFTFIMGRTVPTQASDLPKDTQTTEVSTEAATVGDTESDDPVAPTLPYPIYFISGYLSWLTGQSVLNRGSAAVLSHTNLVKQVVFPLEVLPIKLVLASIISQLVAIVFLVALSIAWAGHAPMTLWLTPILLFVQILAMIGIAFILSSLTVYLRDLREVIARLSPLGLYISPIIFRANMPDWATSIFMLNPFSYFIWAYRDVFFYGEIRHPFAWIVVVIGSPVVFLLGYSLFRKLKPQFANAL